MEKLTLLHAVYAYQAGMLCFIIHFSIVNPKALYRNDILPWLLVFTLIYPLAYAIGAYGKFKKRKLA